MNHKLMFPLIVVILVITVTSPFVVLAQGDGRSLDRAVLDKWCTDHGYVGVEVDGSQNNVFGLGCKDRAGKLYGLDMIAICTSVYGSSWATPQYSDFNNPNSWRCYPTQGSTPTVAPQPQAPSGETGSSGGQSSGGGNPNVNPTPVTSSGGNSSSGGSNSSSSGSGNSSANNGSTGNKTSSSLCPNTPPSRVSVGMNVQRAAYTRYGQGRIRTGPGQGYAVARIASFGEALTIISGPSCGGNSAWWQVRFGDGLSGWMMEGYLEPEGPDYYMEPWQGSGTSGLKPDFSGDQESNGSASLIQPYRCTVPVEAFSDSSRGGKVLAIHRSSLPGTFRVHFGGILVPDSDGGVRHDGYAGPATGGVTYLGIAERWVALGHWDWATDSKWIFSYPC